MSQSADRDEYAVAADLVFEDRQPPESQDEQLQTLGNELMEEFRRAESDRMLTEQRWLKDLRQYRGQYDPDVISKIGAARSRAFVRKTRVKVKTTDSRVADLLFPTGTNKNWEIDSTPKPSLDPEQKAAIEQALREQMVQQAMAQAQQAAAEAEQAGQDPAQVMAAAEQQIAMLQQQPIPPEAIEAAAQQEAKERAKKMSKVIEDQLVESRYKPTALKVIHSGHLYGIGILKGPLVDRRVRTRFKMQGGKWKSVSESYIVPFVDFVPIWRWYPDMSASELESCRYVYERHTMTRHEMSALAERPSFRGGKQKIIDWIKANPKGHATPRYWDNELRTIGERHANQGDVGGTYEVLERWGWLTGEQLKNAGVKVPEDRCHEAFFANVWLLPNGAVLKAALQQIDGTTWPYHLYYFDKDESSIFPEGLASIMRDDQDMLNASTRMMIDNAAITSGPQLEVSAHLLAKAENVDEHYPWKIWFRNNQSPGERAVKELNFNSNIGMLAQMAAMFENNADETTAIPRYMSGENATRGAAGTSSGLSMLMGAVNIVIKDLVTNYDEGVTVSFIKGTYHWNMRFNPDDSIKGDYDVHATGSASLVAKEVRARQINEFAQLTANPLDEPWIKRGRLNRLRAEANELVDIVKTDEEFQAEQNSPQAQMQMQMQQQMLMLQMQELAAKIANLMAAAEKSKASIKLVDAQAVSTNVSAAFAALQAGGVATQTPFVAPAGDEILRSSGWVDRTPEPTMAQLSGPPVQTEQVGAVPRAVQSNTDPVSPPNPDDGMPPAAEPADAGPDPATGLVGMRQGIETPRID